MSELIPKGNLIDEQELAEADIIDISTLIDFLEQHIRTLPKPELYFEELQTEINHIRERCKIPYIPSTSLLIKQIENGLVIVNYETDLSGKINILKKRFINCGDEDQCPAAMIDYVWEHYSSEPSEDQEIQELASQVPPFNVDLHSIKCTRYPTSDHPLKMDIIFSRADDHVEETVKRSFQILYSSGDYEMF